jgi:hypothetical protein
VIANERASLQSAVDDLVSNGLRRPPVQDPDGRTLVSLAELVGGPKGRFTANLAGKRVDYSGCARVARDRAVERGAMRIPRVLALELFKPFLYEKLEARGFVTTIKAAKRMVEKRLPEVVDLLDEALGERLVLALPAGLADQRSAVAAFRARAWDEWAVAMHPDDADALGIAELAALHLPLSARAMAEASERLAVRPLPPASEDFAELRPWIVTQADCRSPSRSLAGCRAATGLCAACAGRPVGTPVGLLAAEGDRGLLGLRSRPPRRGWVARSARAGSAREVASTLFDVALDGEIDPVADPETRGILGRNGWDVDRDGR